MEIVLAGERDMTEIMTLIAGCISQMRAKGNDQWNENYPDLAVVTADIRERCLYAAKGNEKILGVITLNEFQDEEYRTVPWQRKEGKILVVHRLAVAPQFQRKGVAGKLMDFAESKAVQENYAAIRLDTYSNNPGAIRFYERRGYIKKGQVRFPYRDLPFLCYEKLLQTPI